MTASPGLYDALRRVAATVLAMGQSRLELATIEAGEAAERLIGAVLIGLSGVLLLIGALGSVSVWAVMLLWGSLGAWAILLLAGLYLVAGTALLLWMRARLRGHPPALAATIAELRRDVVMLRGEADAAPPQPSRQAETNPPSPARER
jgi:uncharacterized membrane protein YqjE